MSAIPNAKCIICGWRGACDRHRIEEGGEYTPDNTLVLCPNCHRAIHDQGEFNQQQTYSY